LARTWGFAGIWRPPIDTPSQQDLSHGRRRSCPGTWPVFAQIIRDKASSTRKNAQARILPTAKHPIPYENLEHLGDKRERDGAPAHDRRNGLQNHEAAATRRADQQCPPRRGRAPVAERLPRAGQSARKGWTDKALCRRLRSYENLQFGDASRRGHPRKPSRSRFRAFSGGDPQAQ
jgi:hypothetical protein